MDVSFLIPSTVPFNTTNSTLGSMRYTKHQRELVIRKMEAQVAERTRKLQLQRESMLREVDIKLNHRLDRVLKKLWEVKIKQVLALEREQRISVAKVLQVTEAERGLLNYTNPTANK